MGSLKHNPMSVYSEITSAVLSGACSQISVHKDHHNVLGKKGRAISVKC